MSDQSNQAPPDQGAAQQAPVRAAVQQPQQAQTQTAMPFAQPTPGIPAELYQREMTRAAQLEADNKKLMASIEEMKGTVASLTEKIGLTAKEREQIAAQRRAEKIQYEAMLAASEHDACVPEDVVALIAPRLTISEDGKVILADDTKQDVKSFVKDLTSKKPYLFRPKVQQGSGASPFPGAAPAAPSQQFDMRTREGATAALHAALLGGISAKS